MVLVRLQPTSSCIISVKCYVLSGKHHICNITRLDVLELHTVRTSEVKLIVVSSYWST